MALTGKRACWDAVSSALICSSETLCSQKPPKGPKFPQISSVEEALGRLGARRERTGQGSGIAVRPFHESCMTAWPHLGVFHARTEACRYHYVQADGQFGPTIQESVCFGLDRFAGGDGQPKTSITKNYVWNGWLTSGRPAGSRSTAATQQPKLALGSVPKVDSPKNNRQ
jgi:hypothetical protein